jgi:hypothetical protein
MGVVVAVIQASSPGARLPGFIADRGPMARVGCVGSAVPCDGARFRPSLRRIVFMRDLTNPSWIKLKGFLFLLVGILASVLLVLEQPTLKTGLLLALAVWCFCRFYYFAFYVIEHYVDPGYKFSGLWDFLRYMLRRREAKDTKDERDGKGGG